MTHVQAGLGVDGGIPQELGRPANPDPGNERPFPVLLGRNDPHRMQLTDEERTWATDIKNMVKMMPDLDNLSDFMYAQFAVNTQGNLETAVAMAYGLQDFVQEYSILHTYAEGCRYLELLIQLFPRQYLSWSFSDEQGTYVLATDAAEMDTTALTSLTKANGWMRGMYYLHTAMAPDFETIRKGHISLVECQNVDWSKKQDFKLLKRYFSQLLRNYPVQSEAWCYNTGVVMNLLTSMAKSVLPKKQKDAFKMGLQSECGLDEIYLVPDVKAANLRILLRLEETLKRRLENERLFTL